jgi:benzil reductase ((S)-benzoin forming)
MHYFILTGTSSGIGLALAEVLLENGHTVFSLSRTSSPKLDVFAERLQHIAIDLTETEKLTQIIENIFEKLPVNDTLKGIYLINNAGTISPIGSIGDVPQEAIVSSLHVNLTATFLLTATFIRLCQSFPVTKRVISLTSGAAKTAYEGWAAYCTAKAGIDAMTRTIGLEQKRREFPVEILAVAPGVVDTPMQTQIRATTEGIFPMQPKFIDLHAKGILTPPKQVALQLHDLLFSDDFPAGDVIDLRTYK